MDLKKLTYELVKDLLPEVGEGTSKGYPFIKNHDDLGLDDGEYTWGTVAYTFNTPSGLYYDVTISYDYRPANPDQQYIPGDKLVNLALVDFTAEGGYEATNRQEVFGVMATIAEILKKEFNRPEVQGRLDIIEYIPAAGKGRDAKPGEGKTGITQRDNLYLTYIKKAVPVKKVEYSTSGDNKTIIHLKESYEGKRTKDGAPGTLKAKITKLYGGDVTIEKAKKLKNRENATAHDKRQANWFINFHSKNENIAPNHTGKAAPYGSGYKKLEELTDQEIKYWALHADLLKQLTSEEDYLELKNQLTGERLQALEYFHSLVQQEELDENYTLEEPSIETQAEEILMPHIVDLTKYMIKKGLSIDDAPEIHFVDDPINAQKLFGRTAFYNPNDKSITLYVTGRHPKDILRSFAHEMIHYFQDCENRLHQTYTTDVNEDDRLRELEEEAYTKGNMYFRSWENSLSEIENLKEQHLNQEDITLTELTDPEGDQFKYRQDSVKGLYTYEDSMGNLYNVNETKSRYNVPVKELAKTIFLAWKEQYTGQEGTIPYSDSEGSLTVKTGHTFYFELDADLIIKKTEDREYAVIEPTGVDPDVDPEEGDPTFLITIQVDPRDLPEKWPQIYYDLIDIIRHEVEHLSHFGPDAIPAKRLSRDIILRSLIKGKILPQANYFRLPAEIDAMLQGLALKAKKKRVPLGKVINDYLDMQDISQEEKENIINLWRERAKVLSLANF
jgi:hypothetical protein